MQFVDTNIFIRHLTNDVPEKARACLEMFQKAQRGEVTLTTTEAVITEAVYILSSKQLYHLPREEIRKLLYPLLSLPGLKLTHRKVYLRALDLYATYPIDFEDAVVVAQMERQGIAELYSYDRDFERIPGVTRVEP